MSFCYNMFAALNAQRAASRRLAVEAEMAMMQAEVRIKLMQLTQLSSEVSVTTTRRSKCPGCGSYEFRKHYLRTICSYCRVEV